MRLELVQHQGFRDKIRRVSIPLQCLLLLAPPVMGIHALAIQPRKIIRQGIISIPLALPFGLVLHLAVSNLSRPYARTGLL